MHLLVLNSMHGKAETNQIAAACLDEQKLKAFHDENLAPEPYDDPDDSSNPEFKDKVWRKVFKKGSPLEWYNPIGWHDPEFPGYHIEWIPEDQLQQAVAFYKMKGATYLEEEDDQQRGAAGTSAGEPAPENQQ